MRGAKLTALRIFTYSVAFYLVEYLSFLERFRGWDLATGWLSFTQR